MDLVQTWTGRAACALREALRYSNEAFARKLGAHVRTVSKWHKEPDIVLRPTMQQALDTLLQQAPDDARARFAALLDTTTPQREATPPTGDADTAQALTVAIAVVVRDSEVLIVQRRGEDGAGIAWQFPAGVVKPGGSPDLVAVRETLAETGVHCSVVRHLGRRLHPITHVYCDYLLCDYLTGDAQNMDPVENVSVTWAARSQLARFIPAEHIYSPILEALEVANNE
ncbi:ADP-ribose pyrophosphatase YjhB (NUDIX family) [Herbihabitans rhizosphaerae]|uniref:ADP-ribose pyrophosphatase YjhB (NUDIX family) n=1 Tax=Herbihabitans rhizosphaerae TaxID=1872711 RepID=A0A4Q7KEI2_9PSEU|nr:NUDIX domain-containing protein [Herbihabitans rhizosphaerae]RZS32491.1 ADP-ribose pyrophosphatase YjhB (NUDIX family) [Herbihabitans rhizosphaerae]